MNTNELITENSKGTLIFREEIDLDALRIIRDNFSEIFSSRMPNKFKALENKEWKTITDEKTAFTLLNEFYNSKVKSELVTYHFTARLESGRRFSKNSLQGCPRPIRHAISKNIYYDIDIKAAHPTFLSNLVTTLQFTHPTLDYYLLHREKLLLEMIGMEVNQIVHTKNTSKIITSSELQKTIVTNKDQAKSYFLKILNGGGNNTSSIQWLNEFYNRQQEFLTLFYSLPAFKKYRDRAILKYNSDKSKEWDNKKGTALNYYLCEIENIALTHMEHYLHDNNIEIGTLCFDGLMIYKKNVDIISNLLIKLEQILVQKMGFEIKLSCKDMNEAVDITGLKMRNNVLISDEGYALFLLSKIQDNIKYDEKNSIMYYYYENEALWRPMKIICLKTEVSKYLVPYIKNDPDPDIVERESFALCSDAKQRRLVSQMEGHIYQKQDYEFILSNFDRKKGFFPIADNKVINLRTLEIRNRTKEDYFTKTTNCHFLNQYDKETVLEYYSQVLNTTNMEHRDCLIKAFAYGITGENNLKMFINIIGTADGGKSCFIEHHKNIMGSFSGMANKRIFVSQHSESIHDSEMFNLCGKRMSFLTETKDTQTFNEDVIKKISGNDCVNIRAANSKETIDMKFDTVLVLATNDMCQFSDPAFKTRLWCFNFNNSFKKDASVPEKLEQMKDHYFTNLCHYAKLYYDEHRNIEQSNEVQQFTMTIINKQDTFQQWNSDQTLFEIGTEEDYCEKNIIYDNYKDFCRRIDKKPDGSITFYSKLEDYYKLNKSYQKTVHSIKIGYVYTRLVKI